MTPESKPADAAPETTLTVESLLRAMTMHDCMTVAGFNGSCERVIRFDNFVKALQSLRVTSTSSHPHPHD